MEPRFHNTACYELPDEEFGYVSKQKERTTKEAVVVRFKVKLEHLSARNKEATGNLNVASFGAKIGARDLTETR
jgi:hypothetical protein